MKILKGIGYGLIGLLILLTGFIVVCAIKPDISTKIADLLAGKKVSASDQEPAQAEPPERPSVLDRVQNIGGEGAEEAEEAPAEPTPELTSYDPLSDALLQGTSDTYVVPKEDDISIPESVAGKVGYQPVTENIEDITDEEAERLSKELGYGEEGDGLVFDELFYPYYNMLDEKGKHLYRQIYANSMAFNRQFRPVETLSEKEMLNTFMAVYNDHPELFWLDTGYACKYKGDGTCVEVDLTFNKTADNYSDSKAQFDKKANELIAGASGLTTDYGKEQYVHDRLIENVAYQVSSRMNQSAYSALVNGSTVCAGYARAMQYVMMELGIPCYYCTGYAGENHAWNIVGLDDGFYNVDVTWDDSEEGKYDYFNKTDKDFSSTHIRRDLSVNLPPCNGTKYRVEDMAPIENLDYPADNPSRMRTLEDLGKTQDDIINSLDDYYYDCYNQVISKGAGEYEFENLIGSESLLNKIYSIYSNGDYKQGYMDNAVSAVGAGTYDMDLLVEELQGHVFRLTHRIRLGY
ncbi:MAG TPA: hypothetical protein DCW47_05655 [Lachnospiraceae bacterium]|nr:hypothetical protein [Lachnospiraceae bacterium]